MEDFTLSLNQFCYIRKHRVNLEIQFILKIILEDEFKLTGTFVTVSGEKRNIQELKNFLKWRCVDNCYKASTNHSIPLITLSDTDSETEEGCETPKKKKIQKKQKYQSSKCSTPLVAKKLVTKENSSEILVLKDQTSPSRKRTRYGSSSPSEKYIPLCVAKNIKETPIVEINCKSKCVVIATNEEKSSSVTKNVLSWPSRIKDATSCGNTNLFYDKNTSAIPLISATPCETDSTSTEGDYDTIKRYTFVSDNKPTTPFTTANFPPFCKTDAICTVDDNVSIMPGFPKEKDTALDDSIEIIDLVGQNQLKTQSKNDTAQLNKLCTKPLNCLKSTEMNGSQKMENVINKRDNISQSSRRCTVRLPKWENASQKLVTKRNLQNAVSGSEFPMPAGLAQKFPKTVTNLSSAIRNNQVQATNNKRNNIVILGSRTAHLPKWDDKNQEGIVTNHKLSYDGLQNVTTGSNFSMCDDFFLQFPIPSTVNLRPVVIDGTNIARAHGLTKGVYSCKGIKISVDYFLRRGHTEVTAFIPQFRKHQLRGKIPTTDANCLEDLEKTGHIAYAPSRKVDGKILSCYNDRFVVQLATQTGGIIVSNSNFQDIVLESEAFRKTVTERLLMFCFVGDKIMFPDDPLGKNGPHLNEFLAFPPKHSHVL